MSRFLARLVSSKKKDDKDDSKSPSFNFGSTKDDKTEDDNPLIELGKEISFKTLLPIVEQQIEAATKTSNLSSATTSTPTATAIANHPMVQKKKSSLGLSKDRSGTVTEAPKKLRINIKQQSAENLMRACEDPKNPIYLRQMALLLLNASLSNPKIQNLKEFLRLNVVQGDNTTSLLALEILDRVLEESENSDEFKANLFQICSDLLPVCVETCKTSASLEQLLNLLQLCHPSDAPKDFKTLLVDLLHNIGKSLYKNRSASYAILRTHYGLDGVPLELQLFEPPVKTDPKKVGTVTPATTVAITSTAMIPSLFKKVGTVEPTVPFLTFTCIKTPRITSNYSNTGTGMITVRVGTVNVEDNSVLLDIGSLSFISNFDVRVSLPFQLPFTVYVETLIDPYLPIKVFSQKYEKQTVANIAVFLPYPQLCRFLRVNVIPVIENPSHAPGFIETQTTAYGLKNVRDPKTLEKTVSAFQSKLSGLSVSFADKRTELSNELESAKIDSDPNSFANHAREVNRLYKDCSEAQLTYHFCSIMYNALQLFSDSSNNVHSATTTTTTTTTAETSPESMIDRWTSLARVITNILTDDTRVVIKKEEPKPEPKPEQPKKITISTDSDIPPPPPPPDPNVTPPIIMGNVPKATTTSTLVKAPVEVLLRWSRAKKVFRNYCVFGPADLRQKIGHWLCPQLELIPSADEWVPEFLNAYFSSKSSQYGMFPRKEVFELIHSMIKEDHYISVSTQLFSLLEQSTNPQNMDTYDVALTSWALLLLSKIVTLSSKPKVLHPDSKCINCGMSPIAGVRYRCANCFNFDICERCERKSSEIHDPSHVFLKIVKPLPLPPVSTKIDSEEMYQPLLPNTLYPDGVKKKKKSRKSKSKNQDQIHVHEGTSCAGCGKNPIQGLRFKCINCQDYDLCENCEGRVEHFPLHVFLKIWHPLPKKDQKEEGTLPQALVPNQALVPMQLHRALYPTRSLAQKDPSLSASPSKIKQQTDEENKDGKQEVVEPKAQGQLTFVDVLSKRTKEHLGKSLGTVLTMDAEESDEESEQKYQSSSGALPVMFTLLCNAANPITSNQESLLLVSNILKKIAKQFTLNDIKEDIIMHPKFGEFMKNIVSSPSPFVHAAVVEMIETLCDPATYENSAKYLRAGLAVELTNVRHSLMQQITSLINQQNNPTAIEFLLEVLDVLTSTKGKAPTPGTTAVGKVEKVQENELNQSTASKPKPDLSWRTKSAPLPITPKEDKTKQLHLLDDDTTGFLLKFLLSRGLTEATSGFWCSTLQLFKHADPSFLVKSPNLLKLFDVAMVSAYEIQTIVQDSFNEFVSFLVAPANPQSNVIRSSLLARVINNLPKIMSETNSHTGILLISGIISALAKPEVVAQCPLNVDQMFKILDSLGQACKNREFAVSDPSDAKNRILENLFKLAHSVLATPHVTFQMADFLKGLCSNVSAAPAQFLEFLHNQKPVTKGAKLSVAKKSEQLFGIEVNKLIVSLSGASVETNKYILSLTVPLLRDGVKPALAQLVTSMTYNEELAKYFAVDLKGCDLLIQILLAQCGSISTGSGLVLPELSAAILQQLYSSTSPSPVANQNQNKKPVKPGTIEELGYTSELQGADSLLQSIFKETSSSNATVWTHKPPANNKDYEFSVTAKLPYNAVLKEVWFNAHRQWYVGSEMSELPSFVTVYVGRSTTKMKIVGRFPCDEQETLNGSTLKGFKFQLNQKTVARFVTLKFKPYNSGCMALTRIQLRGVSMQSFITSTADNPELLNLTTKVLAHIFSYAAIQSHLAKTFTEDSALKLLGLLRGPSNAFIEDILYFVAKSNPSISSALLKNLMSETAMTTQHAQLAGRLCAFKDEHAAQKISKLKEFVFAQLSNKLEQSISPALIPLMNSLCQAVRKVTTSSSDEAKVLQLSENELDVIHKCASDSLEGTHMEDASMKLLSAFVQFNSKYLDTIIAKTKATKTPSGRGLRVLAILASSGPSCGKSLSSSGLLETILSQLVSQIQSNQPLNVVQEPFKFFADIAYAQTLRDWEVKNLIPKMIDLWPQITLPLVPLYVKVLSVCANMHKTTQESVGSFLVNLIKSSGSDSKKQQAVFELMEGLLSTQDNLYISLQHADDRTDEVHGLGTAPASKSVPLEWDTTNAGPAVIDGANVKKTTADYCYTTVKGVESFNSGVYYFEVEIVNSTGNIFVGICEFTHQHNCYLGQYNSMNVSSYGLMGTASPYFYCAISTEGTTKSFGKAFTKGDIIGCEVDFDAGTLTYFKNGETIGCPHDKGFKDKEYHASITLYAPNDEVNLVSATRTGVAKVPSKTASPVPKKPVNTKEALPFSLSLDSPLRFHRSTNVFCVPTNTPFIDFFNEIQTRERLKITDGGQVQISVSANGKPLSASPLATQELLAQAFNRPEVGDCEIIDLQFNTQMMPINQQDVVQVQIPKDVGGNSKIADIVVKSKGLTLLVDNVLNYIKEQNKKKPEDHLTTWMKWLDVLKSQTQIEGYSTKFLQHKGCRALLFKAMKGELNLTPSKELVGVTVSTVPAIQAKERDALAVELDMFEPLLKSFGQLFAHTAVAAEDKVSKAVRQAAIENGLIERLLINLSDLTGNDMRNPNKFTKNSLYVELRDKAKREKDKREKERAANKANKAYWAKGTGYGTSSDAQNTWDQTTFAKIIELKSKQQAMMLNAIAAFLDVPASEGESHLPNVSDVLDLLDSSCVIPVLLSYLRNDSLLDIAKQMDLYNSLFNLVQVIARQPEFAILLDVLPNESGSVHQLMNQLNNMAQMMLRNAEKAKKIVEANPKSKEDAKRELEEANMAKLIISVASDVKKSLEVKQAKLKKEKEDKEKKDKDKTEGKKESKQEEKDEDIDVDAMEEITGDTEEDKKKMERNKQKKEKLDKVLSSKNMTLTVKYKTALIDLQFGERDMTKSGGGYIHHYATRISQESSAMPNKLKRLVQEISSLSSGLPLIPESSVFMRVDQDRPDVMTAMITGPPGTPYSNGCYEFHIYCPSDYPKVPPVVNLETTGHGSVRFNPNLYNCGKVCLSLLGTWSGQQNEQWNEKTSTILQVLVSIQSLIMVERPYYNEPGYESQMGSYNGEKQSKAYIDNIRVQSIRWAMVDQLKNPSPGYEDVIKTHFKIKKQVIYREIQQWIKDSSSSQAKLLQEQFDQLKKLVDALGD